MSSKPLPAKNIIIAVLALVLPFVLLGGLDQWGIMNARQGTKKVGGRNALQSQAFNLAEQFKFDEALALYKKAIEPERLNQDYEKSTAIGAMTDILIVQGRYEEAKRVFSWFLEGKQPPAASAIMKIREIDALIEFSQKQNSEVVRQYIDILRNFERANIPPVGHDTIPITELLQLYDIIGDYDAGIAFVNKCISYFRDNKRYEGDAFVEPIEYVKIREAFEQDKAEGKKGCVGKKSGEVCMGRATQAIIQSDYFPW